MVTMIFTACAGAANTARNASSKAVSVTANVSAAVSMRSSKLSSNTTTRPVGNSCSRARITAVGVCCGSRYRCNNPSAVSVGSSRHRSVNRFGKFTGCPSGMRDPA